jgi:hypothetical protein
LKAQVVIDKKRKKILYVLVGKGREHDFKLFKRANIQFYELSEVLGDRGYQGLQHFHANSQTPQRKPPKQPLSKAAKRANRELANLRITVEHVIRDRSAELTTKPENLSHPQRDVPQQAQAVWA